MTASANVHMSWARTKDPSARTAAARAALQQRWLDEAEGDPVRAEHLKKAHYLRMNVASIRARRKAKELLDQAEAVEAELAASGGDDVAS